MSWLLFTLDSPVPFDIDAVFRTLNDLNDEMEQGCKKIKTREILRTVQPSIDKDPQ